MKAAFVSTWTQPVPGRERKLLEWAGEADAYWRRRAKEGKCTAPETFFSETGFGIRMVKGEREDLMALSMTDEVQLLTMRGELLLKDFTTVLFHTGDAAEKFMVTFGKALETI
ncbi:MULTISPECIES: hypothetical protein [unclassified Kitasatospora]|uniref:hypothetical protein n=1 Tax=unclassified Kitasatospora TaxID=2633591 RepID=UPI0033E46244